MPRGKTQRQRKRKSRASLQITDNNLNLNEDPNVKWNVLTAWNERNEMRENREAQRKLADMKENSFAFSLNDVTTRPHAKLPMRAMNFVSDVEFNTPIKVLYKGFQPRESYFCYVVYTRNFSEEQSEYIEYYNLSPQGVWNIYILPPVDFFKSEYHIVLPQEPTYYFFSRSETIDYLLQLPHLQEKVKREYSAIQTLPESIRRYQRQAVTPMGEQFTRVTGREVPENVEGIIRKFI